MQQNALYFIGTAAAKSIQNMKLVKFLEIYGCVVPTLNPLTEVPQVVDPIPIS